MYVLNLDQNGKLITSKIKQFAKCVYKSVCFSLILRKLGQTIPETTSIKQKLYITNTTFDSCRIESDHGHKNGGGIYFEISKIIYSPMEIIITNSTFYNCYASNGGAIYMSYVASNPEYHNAPQLFIQNTATNGEINFA